MLGWFDPTLDPLAWFSETAQPDGWFGSFLLSESVEEEAPSQMDPRAGLSVTFPIKGKPFGVRDNRDLLDILAMTAGML